MLVQQYCQYFYNATAAALRMLASGGAVAELEEPCSLGALLRSMDQQHLKSCDKDQGQPAYPPACLLACLPACRSALQAAKLVMLNGAVQMRVNRSLQGGNASVWDSPQCRESWKLLLRPGGSSR